MNRSPIVDADADLTGCRNSNDQTRSGAEPIDAGFQEPECGPRFLGTLVKITVARTG